jgi:hypothetical protein
MDRWDKKHDGPQRGVEGKLWQGSQTGLSCVKLVPDLRLLESLIYPTLANAGRTLCNGSRRISDYDVLKRILEEQDKAR